MLAGLLAASLAFPQTSTIELVKGAELPGQPFRYWAVEDTSLDASLPNASLGGRAFLQGGPGKTILIRFSDLRRALGPNRKVVDAKIVLTPAAGQRALLRTAALVQAPWNEGPSQVVNFANIGTAAGDAPPFSATFRMRRAGSRGSAWQSPGAVGAADAVPIANAKFNEGKDGTFELTGITSAIQSEYDSALLTGGISLRFEEPIEFFSSQASTGRPRLVITTETLSDEGPDLAVASVKRSPNLPLQLGSFGSQTEEQDGLAVEVRSGKPGSSPNLKDGETVTYTATVRNAGKTPINGFTARWAVREEWGSFAEFNRSIAPGETTTIQYTAPFQSTPGDSRIDSISVEVRLKENDANPSNNGLCVPMAGKTVAFVYPDGFDPVLAEARDRQVISFINGTLFQHSRFSFAADGVKLRLIATEPMASKALPQVRPPASSVDVVLETTLDEPVESVVKRLLFQLGVPESPNAMFTLDGPSGTRVMRPAGVADGILGGDTRFDGMAPALLDISPDPYLSELLKVVQLEPTDLLGVLAVKALNDSVDDRSHLPSEVLYRVGGTNLVRALDVQGRPLAGAKLEFFAAINDGKIDLSKPIGSTLADDRGTVTLANRDPKLGSMSALTNLKPNPFGRIDARGRNAVYLVRATFKGQTEFAWLRLSHLVATALRSNLDVSAIDMRFNFSDGTIDSTNLAKGRLVTDIANSLPAKLAGLTDDNDATVSTLAGTVDEWIELDLGRDRIVGEVRIAVDGSALWNQFDIYVHATGQTSAEAIPWAMERFAGYRLANDFVQRGAAKEIIYRGAAQRFRFIRIQARSKAAKVAIRDIRVYGVAQG